VTAGAQRLEATFLASAQREPGAILVHHRGKDWTYDAIARRAGAVAVWLRDAGVGRDTRVVLQLPNGPEYVIAYYGILLAGGTAVAINPATTPDELEFVLRHSEATALCVPSGAGLAEVVARVPSLRAVLAAGDGGPQDLAPLATASLHALGESAQPAPALSGSETRDLAQIIYTSGTTGEPKGVMLTHRNLHANTQSIIAYLGLGSADSVLVILPFYYSYGNSLLQTHVAVGGRLVIPGDVVFWNRVLDLLQAQHVTGFSGVPASYAMLLNQSDMARREFPDLRYLTCAGGALARPLVERLRAIVPQVELFLMYGQTEASARLTSLLPHEVDLKVGSAGRGIPGVEITIRNEAGVALPPREVGELVAQGENVMQGFWRDPEATAAVLRPEGLYTKDMGWMDEDGYVWIVGRKDDVIKSGSYRISPEELEHALLAIPGVREVAVVGEPHPYMGEVPVAFVVGDDLDPERVLKEAQVRIPRFKCVRKVYPVNELPRTDTGKVRRRVLREGLRAPFEAETTGGEDSGGAFGGSRS
jgi:acyl-CoA synthetase (AMP-forming)/AMP-acid ligase II